MSKKEQISCESLFVEYIEALLHAHKLTVWLDVKSFRYDNV